MESNSFWKLKRQRTKYLEKKYNENLPGEAFLQFSTQHNSYELIDIFRFKSQTLILKLELIIAYIQTFRSSKVGKKVHFKKV